MKPDSIVGSSEAEEHNVSFLTTLEDVLDVPPVLVSTSRGESPLAPSELRVNHWVEACVEEAFHCLVWHTGVLWSGIHLGHLSPYFWELVRVKIYRAERS